MKTAVTLCRVPESASGPFVFHDDLETGFSKAAQLGFDAVELFLPSPHEVSPTEIKALCIRFRLSIAAVGTGAGMVRHGLSLTDPDPAKRSAALDFILQMIEFAGRLGAPAILGSMQGRSCDAFPRPKALEALAEALRTAGVYASTFNVPFIYEPLNRYETNLFNQTVPAAEFLLSRNIPHVTLLADLFHMAIEETDIATTLREASSYIGHIHWADSNRNAIGLGHTNPQPIASALRDIHYQGYLSAEIRPLPDPMTAASTTLEGIRKLF